MLNASSTKSVIQSKPLGGRRIVDDIKTLPDRRRVRRTATKRRRSFRTRRSGKWDAREESLIELIMNRLIKKIVIVRICRQYSTILSKNIV
jgi:hypothetical protein